MNISVKSFQIVLIAVAIFCVAAISAPKVFADSYDACDFCGYGSSYTPAYESDFYPSYDTSYTPSYDSSYYPSYDSSYYPSYDTSYYPSYDSSYYPSYDTSYTPSYDSSYYPSYDSSYYPSYDSSYTPHYSTPPSYNPPHYTPPTYTPPKSTPPIVYNFTTPSHPVTFAQPQQQQQQQQQQGGGSGPIIITNTNNNNNVNTNTNVNTAPVVTVASAPVTYPVQYVYPQTYPTYNYPTYSQAPSCTITLSGNVLTWYSSYATSAYITPNIGQVALSGSRTVYANYGTVYTMGVSGQGGSANCQTTYVYNTYIPSAPSVSLSQIPYTGFDFGPFGNAMYWLSLLSFAVAAAYLVVYYRGGAFTLATSLLASRNPRMAAAISAPMKAIENAVAPIAQRIDRVMGLANLPVIESKRMTTDAMTIARSKEGEVPRIVITRG